MTIGSWVSFSAAVGVLSKASPRPVSTSWRLARSFACRAVSTWSSWTGVAVCVTGIVESSASTGDCGVPGLMSTKKLPSRNRRGRIFMFASLWIGRPSFSISIVTLAIVVFGSRSTAVTLPTLTPAIRTGELIIRLLEVSKTACSS